MTSTGAGVEADSTVRAQQTAWKRGLAVSDELRKAARAVRQTTTSKLWSGKGSAVASTGWKVTCSVGLNFALAISIIPGLRSVDVSCVLVGK